MEDKIKIGVIGSKTLGNPTEIYEILHGNNQVILVENESKTATFKIENIYDNPESFILPLTRKQRRKLARKNRAK
jgi:hypothetical protein